MDLVVACVGTRMPTWIADGWQEYARRLPPHLKLELLEIPVAGKAAGGRESAAEAESLLARVPERARRIALHGDGKPWSTENLADRMADWQQDGDPVWFFIGGANGLAPELLATCHGRWSFGPAVFPHMLVRVMVAEQLYRAWTILSGHPYHRA
jgi:23S rRNA (pseudouridine1915-N3)-methyltransferase